jgi:hypothetical protein
MSRRSVRGMEPITASTVRKWKWLNDGVDGVLESASCGCVIERVDGQLRNTRCAAHLTTPGDTFITGYRPELDVLVPSAEKICASVGTSVPELVRIAKLNEAQKWLDAFQDVKAYKTFLPWARERIKELGGK